MKPCMPRRQSLLLCCVGIQRRGVTFRVSKVIKALSCFALLGREPIDMLHLSPFTLHATIDSNRFVHHKDDIYSFAAARSQSYFEVRKRSSGYMLSYDCAQYLVLRPNELVGECWEGLRSCNSHLY
jgi:hypothetical protein